MAGLVAGSAACGGQDEPVGASYQLADQVEVDVAANGAVAIRAAGRPLATLSDEGPQAARFGLRWQSLFGMWKFSRDDEQRYRFDRFVASEATEKGVRVRYQASDGTKAYIELSVEDGRIRLRLDSDGEYQSLAVGLRCDEESSFYGFGAQYNQTDQRGEAFDLFSQEQGLGRKGVAGTLTPAGNRHTSYYPMPYFMDARGWGMLLNTDYRTVVDLCQSDKDVAWFEVESQEPLDADLFQGPTPAKVVEQLGAQVGRPAKPPAWAYSLWIGAQGGKQALLDEVAALEAAQIPVGVFWVQDWTGPRPNAGGGSGVQYRWTADENHYPKLATLVADLKTKGYRFLSYANPFVMPNLPDHFADMDAAGQLIKNADGSTLLHPSPAGDSSHPDLTNPATREYVKGFLRKMVSDYGMDGWMADFAEWLPLDAQLADGRDPLAYHNRYPEAWHRLSREVMDELRSDGDWVVFSRSGWSGQQSVAQVVWCGDQEATFEPEDGLPSVVPCLLNLGLSGVPFATHEIAGFSGGPSTKELYIRWIELAAFTPIMRTHEGDRKDENWSWEKDAETTEQLRRFAIIHDALAKDFEPIASEAAASSLPMVRHLMLQFPDDPQSRSISDQFMLGDSLLVAPVVVEGALKRDVYLPPGDWYHVWTGKKYAGGTVVEVSAPLGSPPVFSLEKDREDLRAIQ